MNIFDSLKQTFFTYLTQTFSSSCELEHLAIDFALNCDERKQQFGDISSNAAMILAKKLQKNPRELAQQIINEFHDVRYSKVEMAGPGFLNFFFKPETLKESARQLYMQKEQFFKASNHINTKINIEFVSANPTGPLHLGHGRGGIIGDVLGNVLQFLGDPVTKEFYINDAGSQIQKLGNSFKIRYEQQLGKDIQLPEESYQGEYLIDLAKETIQEHGNAFQKESVSFFAQFAKEKLLDTLKETLGDYGITYNVWFSEKTLHDSDAITHALAILKERGHTYEQEGAVWFRSTEFGDDKDRVLKKQNGELTYAAADVAYLLNKIERGFTKLIMILGQDHHSYVVRLKGIMQALGYNPDNLIVILYQLVTLKESGAAVRMSKRTGNIVTLTDVITTVGTDAARYFYLNKKADAHLEFDIDLALKNSEENPVYYIQYGFVRTVAILNKAFLEEPLAEINEADSQYITQSEALLLKKIATLQSLLETISNTNQTHLLTYYAQELVQQFHKYYAAHRVIDLENREQSRGRLLTVKILNTTLKLCLDLLGINAPERM